MSKETYHFNLETLTYEKRQLNFKKRISWFCKNILPISFVIACILSIAFINLIESYERKRMSHENELMVKQYVSLNNQLDLIRNTLQSMQKRDDKIYRTFFELKPIPGSIREAGFGGADKYRKFEGTKYSDLVIQTSKRIDQISKQLLLQSQSYDEIAETAKKKLIELACLPALRPISSNLSHITSGFGLRMHPILNRWKAHTGIDYSAAVGTIIYAPGDGIVKEVDFAGGYGRQVLIDHGFGYETRYGHLQKAFVKEGQKVKRGDKIAVVGNSGLSTSPHLHYEVIMDGNFVNPEDYYFIDYGPEEYILANNDKNNITNKN